MKHLVCFVLVIVLATMALDPDCRASSGDDDQETSHQISLADLAGYASYLTLLSAEQAYQQAELNLIQAQANRYADTAALFQALGGGWWNRPDIPKS